MTIRELAAGNSECGGRWWGGWFRAETFIFAGITLFPVSQCGTQIPGLWWEGLGYEKKRVRGQRQKRVIELVEDVGLLEDLILYVFDESMQ